MPITILCIATGDEVMNGYHLRDVIVKIALKRTRRFSFLHRRVVTAYRLFRMLIQRIG